MSTQTVKVERILSGGFEGAPIFFSVATEDFDTRWRQNSVLSNLMLMNMKWGFVLIGA